ncbi:hypothetical protein M422DRAFT_256800 [Sphaerobolus stellatus SS14]|uniref:Unplaced genomic scaffold SPHSTscaffold_70, whole genome shotgun sequence n=1 Tax=Sphaerobolus stellatus (strain SS14) TaxID=990650 RepID=A0A0C9UZF5_SPHS4|nr:hypothetical protein M422DRAFT_256800 [Sphaerobolus stellatus SS14]
MTTPVIHSYLIAGLGSHLAPLARRRQVAYLLSHTTYLLIKLRSSVGQLVLESLAAKFRAELKKDRSCEGWSGTAIADIPPRDDDPYRVQVRLTFFKPRLPTRQSGRPVFNALKKHVDHPITISKMIILHESLDLAPMDFRRRREGRPRNHPDLMSFMAFTKKNNQYMRVALGVGRPKPTEGFLEEDINNYISEKLSDEEQRFWRTEGADVVWDSMSYQLREWWFMRTQTEATGKKQKPWKNSWGDF